MKHGICETLALLSKVIDLNLTTTDSQQSGFRLQFFYKNASLAFIQGSPLQCAKLHIKGNGKSPHNNGQQIPEPVPGHISFPNPNPPYPTSTTHFPLN